MSDQEIVDAYFSHPEIKDLLIKTCGPNGKIKVDWVGGTIKAIGAYQTLQWDLKEFLEMLRAGTIQ